MTGPSGHNGAIGKPLHILVLTDRDWSHPQGGGTGTSLHAQVTWWLAGGHRVTIIACGYPGGLPFEQDGALTLHRIGGRSTVFPRTILTRAAERVAPDADVVLEIINGLTFLTPLWLDKPRVGVIHHVHLNHYIAEMGFKGRLAAFAFESAPVRTLYRSTPFVTASHATARDIAALGVPADRIVVNYHGVDSDRLRPGHRATEPMLLYLGRLKRYKRVEWLLDPLYELPEAMLHIAGDGDHRPALEREIDRRGLRHRVVMHGFVDEQTKRELLQAAWLNMTASRFEGWGLTIIEAGACGTPSVAMASGGLTEAVVDRSTGLLARSRRELSAHAVRIMRDHELRERLGTAARLRAGTLNWRDTAERTLQVLQMQVHGKPVPQVRRSNRFARAAPGRPPQVTPLPGDAVLLGRATGDPAPEAVAGKSER